MKGKRVASLGAALVLGLGALAGFAGCDRTVTSDLTRVKVYAAIAESQIFQVVSGESDISRVNLEYRTERETESYDAESDVTVTDAAESIVKVAMYQQDDFYADVFEDTTKTNEVRSASGTTASADRAFNLTFSRGDATYSYSGERAALGVEKGDFDGAIKSLKKGKAELTAEDGVGDPDIEFSDESIGQLQQTLQLFDCAVVQSASGYRVTLDAVSGIGKMLEKIGASVEAYQAQPQMQVRRFFEEDAVKKLLQVLYAGKGKEVASNDFSNLLAAGTGRAVTSGFPNDIRAFEHFYQCLDSETLYQKLVSAQAEDGNEADISSSDGTIGGMNLSALFGTPEEAQTRLEKITDSPDVFLLNYLFGFNGTADEGALNYAVSFELDKKFEVKQAALSASYQTVNYTESDRIGSYDKSKYSAQVDVKVPKKNPKLTNLKGIKGYTPPTPSEAPDYGKRPKIGTYQSKPQKLTLNLEWLEPAEDVQGNSLSETENTLTYPW